jgi:hypothetical protein
LLAAPIGKGVTLFLIGMAVSVGYNIFAALEEVISVLLWEIEQQHFDIGD